MNILDIPNIDPPNREGKKKKEKRGRLNSYITYHILSVGVSSDDAVRGMRGK